MKRNVRLSALVLSLLLACASLAGCGAGPAASASASATLAAASASESPAASEASAQPVATTPDISKEANIITWIVGEEQPDSKIVYEKINALLKEKINATMEPRYTTWTDYMTKYQLVFASDESFDLASSYSFTGYNDLAMKGGYLEITMDDLKKYLPTYAADVNPQYLEEAKVNCKLYMIPTNAITSQLYPFAVRGDLMEKYGMTGLKTFDDIDKYLRLVAKNESGTIAYNASGADGGYSIFQRLFLEPQYEVITSLNVNGQPLFCIRKGDRTGTLLPVMKLPEYKAFIERMNEWYDLGIFSKNILSNEVSVGESFKSGKSAANLNNYKDVYSKIDAMQGEHADWKLQAYDVLPADTQYIGQPHTTGMGIHATSENVERSFMLINLLNTDKAVYDLMTYGIEGRHYVANGDSQYTNGPDFDKYNENTSAAWAVFSTPLSREPVGKPQSYYDMHDKLVKNTVAGLYPMFNFNQENVKAELAAVTNAYNSTFLPMACGVVKASEIDASYQKLLDSGLDKITTELEKQMAEFVKSHIQ